MNGRDVLFGPGVLSGHRDLEVREGRVGERGLEDVRGDVGDDHEMERMEAGEGADGGEERGIGVEGESESFEVAHGLEEGEEVGLT